MSEWVKCRDRMPDEYDDNIWVFNNEGVFSGYLWDGSNFSDWVENYITINGVTHWMPMAKPEPPKD